MSVIYEPKGPAREYAPLAVNLYEGCIHACQYPCYAPGVMHKKRSVFHTNNQPRENILERLTDDCSKMRGDPREILLCFTCDPYQDWADSEHDITRQALIVLSAYRLKATVLTKGGLRAERDFDILARNGWSFGTTLSMGERMRRQWEPGAASIENRLRAIIRAHSMGIRTWVSVEPVIDCTEALGAIETASPWVDHWKIGKISYNKEIEDREDWPRFLEQVEELLRGQDYYIKDSLWAAAGRKERNKNGDQ